MSATSTHIRETSRSLNNSQETQKGNKNHQYSFFLALVIVFSISFLSQAIAAEGNKLETKKTAHVADVLRQDVLRFAGPATDASKISMPSDGFLVRLNRRNVMPVDGIPMNYGMLVRGLDPMEQALLEDAQDGKWDNFDLFKAALVAEGIRDPEQIRKYEARMHAILAEVYAKVQADTTVANGIAGSAETLTKELFEALHRNVFTKPYDINCTEIGRVLETGNFNCVSATVLFNCVAEKAGLNVCALEMPGHALSRVKFDNVSMNLETTCPNWFSLQNETARQNATLKRIASIPAVANPALAADASIAESNETLKKVREISPVQLIATIYYNRGVDLLAEKRYAEAAAANIKALHLDPTSETAWGNLLASLNNWAIELATGNAKRYDLAATLLDQGVYLDSNYDKFRANQLHIFYQWIRELALEGRVADAQTVYDIAAKRLPGNADLKNLMQAVVNN